jgi:hypothetical protein
LEYHQARIAPLTVYRPQLSRRRCVLDVRIASAPLHAVDTSLDSRHLMQRDQTFRSAADALCAGSSPLLVRRARWDSCGHRFAAVPSTFRCSAGGRQRVAGARHNVHWGRAWPPGPSKADPASASERHCGSATRVRGDARDPSRRRLLTRWSSEKQLTCRFATLRRSRYVLRS